MEIDVLLCGDDLMCVCDVNVLKLLFDVDV